MLSDHSRRWLTAVATTSGSVANVTETKAVCTPSYQEIRSEMVELEDKKLELQAKARLCFNAKQYAVASYYGDETRKVQKKIENLSRSVVDAHQKTSHSSNKFDLHGFKLDGVLTMLANFLERKQNDLNHSPQRKMVLELVTGWGSHGTAPKIKPQVINYLDSKRYR